MGRSCEGKNYRHSQQKYVRDRQQGPASELLKEPTTPALEDAAALHDPDQSHERSHDDQDHDPSSKTSNSAGAPPRPRTRQCAIHEYQVRLSNTVGQAIEPAARPVPGGDTREALTDEMLRHEDRLLGAGMGDETFTPWFGTGAITK